MAENERISEEQLPHHDGNNLPETGTPAGTVWHHSLQPPLGSRSGGATGFEADAEARDASGASAAAGAAGLTPGEREALQAAVAGAPPVPGDLSRESEYEVERDVQSGGEQETEAERRLRHPRQGEDHDHAR